MADFRVGDYGKDVRIPFTQGGAAYNLTGCSVTCVLDKPNGTVATKIFTLGASATLGTAYFTLQKGDLDCYGWYYGTAEVLDPAGNPVIGLHGKFSFEVDP